MGRTTSEQAPAPPVWLELSVRVAGMDSELAADIFRQACPGGVAVEPAWRLDTATDTYVPDGDGPATVKGYIPADADSARLRRSLRLAVQVAPLQAPPAWQRSRRLRESSWRDAWKAHFPVLHIGGRLVIAPTWAKYKPRPGEIVIWIDPGMAFGTGQHQTTAMCLQALEEHVRADSSVLDLGCGSGILAIAATRLGAAHVLALDLDPLAVKAARQNAEANGVGGVIEVREGTLDIETLQPGAPPAFDVAAANISGLALERLAPALAAALRPRGVLITSGFLEDAVEGLRRAYEAAGLRIEGVEQDGIWRAIIAVRC